MKTIDVKLFELAIFQQLLEKIILISARQDVPIDEPSFNKDCSLTETEWIKCLGIASFLAFSEIPEYQETALRIAQTSLQEYTNNQLISSTAVYVLNCLTNNVAIDLAIQKKNLSLKISLKNFLLRRDWKGLNLFTITKFLFLVKIVFLINFKKKLLKVLLKTNLFPFLHLRLQANHLCFYCRSLMN